MSAKPLPHTGDDRPGRPETQPVNSEQEASARPLVTSCPLLGFDDDRQSRAFFATPDHRCYAAGQTRIALDDQERFCLGPGFAACPRYAATQRQEVATLGQPGPRFHRRSLVMIAGGGLGAAVLLVAAFVLGFGGDQTTAEDSRSTPATALPAAATTALPSPTSARSPTPPASPTASTSATPGGPRVHVVQAGETLSAIAARFGTTVDTLVRLNNLDSASLIRTGQTIILPDLATPGP